MTYLEEHIGKIVVKHRWWIIFASLICVGFATFGMGYLSFSSDSRVFFSEENPQLKALETLENIFTKDNNVMFTLAPKDGNVFTNKTLAAVENLTRMCWEIPYSSRVDSITNYQNTYSLNDDLVVEDLVSNAPALSGKEIRRIRKIALSEILLVNRLVSPTGHVTGVNVNILKQEDGNIVSVVVDHVRKITRQFKATYPDIDVYLTGTIISDKTFEEASKRDMGTLIPIMLGMLILLIGIALRSVSGTIATVLVIAFSMLCGLGLAGWAGIVITSPSSNTPMIIMTLAVADSIHILVTILQQMKQGVAKNEAIKESVRVNFNPIFLTSLTTGIGFLTMNFSDAPPFHDLGNIVAMGIVAAFCFSIFFLPALMSLLPLRVKKTSREQTAKPFERIARFNIRHRRYLLPGLLVLSILTALGIFNIELNDNFLKYFDHRYEFRQASDFMEENLSGIHIIEYSLDTGETNGINDLDYLNTIDEFAQWYRTQPDVVHVNNIADIVKRLNKNMHNDDPAFYRIPRNRELAAQYFLLYDMSLPFGLDLNNQINVDKSSSRLTVTMKDASSGKIRATDERARQWLMENAPKEMFTYGTGIDVIFAHISQRNIRAMLTGSFCALVMISAIIMVALRNVRLGIISLLPNLLPAFMAFGIWGITASQVGLALTIMVSLTLGIVVDDTVHFMSKYNRARKEYGMPAPAAVEYAFNTVGAALWATTLILSAGFMVLSFSGFKMNSDMGIMTTITIIIAIGLDFFLLPSLLMITEGKNDEKSITDHGGAPVGFRHTAGSPNS